MPEAGITSPGSVHRGDRQERDFLRNTSPLPVSPHPQTNLAFYLLYPNCIISSSSVNQGKRAGSGDKGFSMTPLNSMATRKSEDNWTHEGPPTKLGEGWRTPSPWSTVLPLQLVSVSLSWTHLSLCYFALPLLSLSPCPSRWALLHSRISFYI